MTVILSGVGFKTSEPLRTYAEHRVLSWLGHLERRLDVITVQIANESHPEGQRARCRLLARSVAGVSLVVEETSDDVYDAIDRVTERMARDLEKATQKQRRPVPVRA